MISYYLGKLSTVIQNGYQFGTSVVAYVRQAIALREIWLEDACVRGRLCVPPGKWDRDLIRNPQCAAELPDDFKQSFPDAKPRSLVMSST